MNISAKIVQRPDFAEVMKQINFGTALGLTNTAKEGQKAVMKSLGDTFTLRGQWFAQSNKYGIRTKMATKDNLSAEVKTQADWLEIHEKGGTKTSKSGHNLAIPTTEVRPKGSTKVLPRGHLKKLDSKRTFVLMTKNGKVLFQRKYKGKRSKIVALYNLEPKAKIKKRSTFYEPIQDIVKKSLKDNIRKGIAKAFATGGSSRGRIGKYS